MHAWTHHMCTGNKSKKQWSFWGIPGTSLCAANLTPLVVPLASGTLCKNRESAKVSGDLPVDCQSSQTHIRSFQRNHSGYHAHWCTMTSGIESQKALIIFGESLNWRIWTYCHQYLKTEYVDSYFIRGTPIYRYFLYILDRYMHPGTLIQLQAKLHACEWIAANAKHAESSRNSVPHFIYCQP